MTLTSAAPPSAAPLPAPPRPPARRRRGGAGRTLVLAALAALLLYPLAWLLAASLKPGNEVVTSTNLLPSTLTWSNYTDALAGIAGVSFPEFLGNTFLVAGGAVVGTVCSCVLAAYAFARLRFRLSTPMFAFMVVTIMMPAHVVLIPQYALFQSLDLVDTFWPLLLPKFLATDAFFVFLIVQFMRGLPRELDEAAVIDGCGPVRIFRYIALPLTRPALITTAIFTFIWTWNDFFTQLIYLSSPSKYTLPLALRLFIDATGTSAYGPMFAMSVLTLVPIGLFFLAFQRFLVQGVATTGLKG